MVFFTCTIYNNPNSWWQITEASFWLVAAEINTLEGQPTVHRIYMSPKAWRTVRNQGDQVPCGITCQITVTSFLEGVLGSAATATGLRGRPLIVPESLCPSLQIRSSRWAYLIDYTCAIAVGGGGEKRESPFPSPLTSRCLVLSSCISFYCCIIRTRFKMTLIYYLIASMGHNSSTASTGLSAHGLIRL